MIINNQMWKPDETFTCNNKQVRIIKVYLPSSGPVNGSTIKYEIQDGQIKTQTEIFIWVIGGIETINQINCEIKNYFALNDAHDIYLRDIKSYLKTQDFSDIAIEFQLQELKNGGYVEFENEPNSIFKIIKTQ